MFFVPVDRRVNDRIPWGIYLLLALNVLSFMVVYWGFDESEGGRVSRIFDLHGAKASDLSAARCITHMYLHAGPLHLVGNLLFLVLFGMNVERRIGAPLTFVLYHLSGLGAVLLFAAFNPGSDVPLVGASGAISGLVGMYLVLFRNRTVEVLWYAVVVGGIVRLPVVVITGFWAGLEVLQALLLNHFATVAHWAHVGGFVAGAGLLAVLVKAGFRGHPETVPPPGEEPRPEDRFEELNYIPVATSRLGVDSARPDTAIRRRSGETSFLVAKSWGPVTRSQRAVLDEVLPGSGPFAVPACLARGLAPAQAEDLAARLDRAGLPVLVYPEQYLLAPAPLVISESAESTPNGLRARDVTGRVLEIPPASAYLLAAGTFRRDGAPVRVVDLYATDPWVALRWSEAVTGAPVIPIAGELRKALPAAPSASAFDALVEGRPPGHEAESLAELDGYHRWMLQVFAGGKFRTGTA